MSLLKFAALEACSGKQKMVLILKATPGEVRIEAGRGVLICKYDLGVIMMQFHLKLASG